MKVSIIGMGRVGSTLAYTIVVRGLASELVLVSRNREIAEGEALDLEHARAFTPRPIRVLAGKIQDTENSDVIVLCCSAPYHKEIKSRFDLGSANLAIFRKLVPLLAERSPNAKLLVITNPTDVMTYHALKLSRFDPSRVFGSGTLIDSARLRAMLSEKLSIHPHDVRAYMLGEHGDCQFAGLSMATAGGSRIEIDDEIREIVERVRTSGCEIMRRKRYTNFAISMAAGITIEAIAQDSRRTMPLSILVDGIFGEHDACLSLPVVVGRDGITQRLKPNFDAEEIAIFHKAAEKIRDEIRRSAEIS